MATSSIAAQTHAGNINLVTGHQGPQVAHDAWPVFVVEQQNDPKRHNFCRLAENTHDSRIVRRTEKCAPGGNDLVIAVKGLDMQPFVEGDRLVGTLLLNGKS